MTYVSPAHLFTGRTVLTAILIALGVNASPVICYGRVTTSAAEAAKLTGPILGIFGAEDSGLPEETLRVFESNVKAAGKAIQLEVYKGAGHAFMNPANPWSGYRPKPTADAWKKIEAFLSKAFAP